MKREMKADIIGTGILLAVMATLAITASMLWGDSRRIGVIEIRGTFGVGSLILLPFTTLGMYRFFIWLRLK